MRRLSEQRSRVLGSVARGVRTHRLRAGLSQQALADRVGVSQQAISSIEAGTHSISVWGLWRLCAALRCTLEEILLWADQPLLGRDGSIQWMRGRPLKEKPLVRGPGAGDRNS